MTIMAIAEEVVITTNKKLTMIQEVGELLAFTAIKCFFFWVKFVAIVNIIDICANNSGIIEVMYLVAIVLVAIWVLP